MSSIRGPGIPLPFTAPQINGEPACIALPSGGIYVIPQGDYVIATGGQTGIQWFDPNNGLWRSTYGPNSIEQVSCDGGNYRLINLSGVCVGASITNAGSGGTNGIGPTATGSTVAFAAPAAGGVTGTATGYVVVGGSVAAPTITQAGSGFLVPPMVFCDPPPPGGVQATAVAALTTAGALTSITMTNVGAGYTSSPQWYIAPQNFNGYLATPDRAAGTFPPPGLIHPNNIWPGSPYQPNVVSATGALLTPAALTGSGTLTAIVMTYFGAGYGSANLATVSFGGTSLGAAAATAIMSLCCTVAVGSTATGQTGATYIVNNPVISSLGIVAASSNNNSFSPRPVRGKVSNATGPAFTVEDPGFGLQSAGTSITLIGGGTVGNINATNLGGIVDTSIIQQATQ